MCPTATPVAAGGSITVYLTNPSAQTNRISYSVNTPGCTTKDDPDPKKRCSVCEVKNQQISLSPLIATPIYIGECEGYKLLFNVRTLERPNSDCYNPPIDVTAYINRTGADVGPSIPPFIDRRFREQADTTADMFTYLLSLIPEYLADLDRIAGKKGAAPLLETP
jgi:hypothetical protein